MPKRLTRDVKLRNSLKESLNEQQLIDIDINPELRAENLSLQQYAKIANAVDSLIQQSK